MRALLYLRVSSDRQLLGVSIETQEQICQEYCARTKQQIIEILKDEGVSALRTKNQRVIELLDHCRKLRGKIDTLVVYKLDRFARSQEQHHWLRSQLQKIGIVVRSATENISEEPSGKLVEGVLAATNEYDNEIRRERTILHMTARLEQGLWPWNPPLGYYLPQIPGVKLAPAKFDDKCVDSIRDIFNLYATGNYTYQAIAHEMNQRCLTNHRGTKLVFYSQKIEKILREQFYIGILLSCMDKTPHQGKHEPLISRSLWEQCQAIRKGRGRKSIRNKYNEFFPLRGFVYAPCDHIMTAAHSIGNHGNRYGYYFCLKRDSGNYSQKNIHDKFLDLIDTIQPPKESINLYFELFIEELGNIYQQQAKRQKELQHQLNAVKLEQAGLVGMRARNEITAELFQEQNAKYQDDIIKLTQLLSLPPENQVDWNKVCEFGKGFMTDMKEKWKHIEIEDKINYQSSIFPEKLHWNGEDYRTPVILEVINEVNSLSSNNVTPVGIEPALMG